MFGFDYPRRSRAACSRRPAAQAIFVELAIVRYKLQSLHTQRETVQDLITVLGHIHYDDAAQAKMLSFCPFLFACLSQKWSSKSSLLPCVPVICSQLCQVTLARKNKKNVGEFHQKHINVPA